VFTGDIDQWGRDLVDWFNRDASPSGRRVFVRAESLEPEVPVKPTKPVKAKKPIKYEHDGTFLNSIGTHYVRAWKGGGRGPNRELNVQVWKFKSTPEGDPDGDWAMPSLLGFNTCILQAIAQTKPYEQETKE